MDGPLSRSQKNEVFQLIKQAGLNPADFVRSDPASENRQGKLTFMLTHPATGCWYLFDVMDAGHHRYARMPSQNAIPGSTAGGYAGGWLSVSDWSQQKIEFYQWLEIVASETQDDLWEAMLGRPSYGNDQEEPDNSVFTATEKRQIKLQLAEVKGYLVSNAGDDPTKLQQIEAKIGYLMDATDRLGKKDWQMVAISTLISLAQTVLLSAIQLDHMLNLLKVVRLFLS